MDKKSFYSFISPSLLVMTVIMLIPLLATVWLSFHYITYSSLNEPKFVGFSNYIEILNDPQFWASYQFTLIYIIVIVSAQLFLGFIIALLLDQITNGRGLYIALVLIPFIITPVVGTLMFRTMFDRGGLYFFLQQWLFDNTMILNTNSVKILILTHGIWYVTPFATITFFAGLQTLPKHTIEAATVDGATTLQKIYHIVLPHCSSLILFVVLMGIMDAYRIFDSIIVMSRDNPSFKVDTIMYYTFKVATSVQRLGKANAASVLTVIGILVVLIPFLRITYKQKFAK